MKNTTSFFILSVNIVLLLIFPTIEGTLYGLSEDVQLLSIDPSTFQVTPIGNPISGELQAQNLATIDNKKGIYYFIGAAYFNETVSLIGLSLSTGEVVKNIVLPFVSEGFVGVGQYVDVDPNTGDVIVVGRTDENGPHVIYRLGTETNAFTKLNTVYGVDILGGYSAYDSIQDFEFLEIADEDFNDYLYVYNAKNGELLKQIVNDERYVLETLDFDPQSGLFYGIGLNFTNSEDNRRILVSLNGRTGEFKQISVIPSYWIISASIASIDVKARTLSCFLSPYGDDWGFDLVTISIETGKIVSAVRACEDDAECPWSIEYSL